MILLTSVEVTLWLNDISYALTALLLFLPEKENINKEAIPSLTVSQIIGDFTIVQRFMKEEDY